MDINGFQILKVLPKVKTMTLKIKMSETLPHISQSRKHSIELSMGDQGGFESSKIAYSKKELLKLFPISDKTLFNLRKREHNPIPFVKLGSRVLYPVSEIHSWWNQRQDDQKGAA